MPTNYALDDLRVHTNQIIVLGDGNSVINQYPKSNMRIINNQPIFLLTDTKNLRMVDIIGMNKKDVLSLFELMDVKVVLVGEGLAVSSSLEVDQEIRGDEVIEVHFE